jgi:hypothetical protein
MADKIVEARLPAFSAHRLIEIPSTDRTIPGNSKGLEIALITDEPGQP